MSVVDYHRGTKEPEDLSGLLASNNALFQQTMSKYKQAVGEAAGNASAGLTGKLDSIRGLLADGVQLDLKEPDLGALGNINAGSFGGMRPPGNTDEDEDDIFTQLFKLIIGIITIPKRFPHLMAASMYTAASLAVGIGGITQSTVLGIKDIAIFIFAIIKVLFKYGKCLFSFGLTFFPCFVVHCITFTLGILYFWLVYLPIKTFDAAIGSAFLPMVDAMLAKIWWPDAIDKVCYSCFGEKVHLSDFLNDLDSVKEVGRMIQYDFDYKIPQYMAPSRPPGRAAYRALDKAFA